MSLALAVLVVVGFTLILDGTGVVRLTHEAGGHAKSSVSLVTDPSLDDREKEACLRATAIALFSLLSRIILGSALAIVMPLIGVWVLDRAGLASFGAVMDVLARLDFLALALVVGGAGYLGTRRLRDR